MRIKANRITKTAYTSTAFDGEGARLYGGRWNSIGTRMVYTASSVSLAALELLVHVEDYSLIIDQYSIIPISFDDTLITDFSQKDLPADWNSSEPNAQTQILGDEWINMNSSVIKRVPSAVVNSESNYLINPSHPDFTKIRIDDPYPFSLDTRLIRIKD